MSAQADLVPKHTRHTPATTRASRFLTSCARRLGLEVTRLERGWIQDPFRVMRHVVTRPNPVILDVGAYVGETAHQFRSLFSDAVIHCFEPFPESYRALCSSLEGDASATVHMIALADTCGHADLSVNRGPYTNSLLPSDPRASYYWGEDKLATDAHFRAVTQTIDAFCEEQRQDHIDILKMDVQGAEYAVLRGAEGMLSRQAVDVIYMEMILAPTYIGQRKPSEYFAFFESRDYELFGLYHPVHREGRLIQADAIVLSTDVLNRYERQSTTVRDSSGLLKRPPI